MSKSPKSLERILKNGCCTGCGLCASVSNGAIEMQTSSSGFLRPQQKGALASHTDQLILDICPGISMDMKCDRSIDNAQWGPLIEVRTGASTNAELKHHASSGGALSAILLYLLDHKEVDYVVQIKASSVSPIENSVTQSTSYEDIYEAAGSRYAPSAPLADLHQYLERPGRFALVGKPCDIAAVRALSQHDPRINKKIPVLLSFFCAGVPSVEGAREILKQLNVAENDVTAFRYRGDGWPGYATATLKDGNTARMDYASSWGNILRKQLQLRCKICPDGTGGFADIVCADAWHCDDKGYPLFENQEGRSLIISRTEQGETIVQQAAASGYITSSPLDVSEIPPMQPGQVQRKALVLSRLIAMAVLGGKPPRFRGFHLFQVTRTQSLWHNLRSFLGMMRRIVKNAS